MSITKNTVLRTTGLYWHTYVYIWAHTSANLPFSSFFLPFLYLAPGRNEPPPAARRRRGRGAGSASSSWCHLQTVERQQCRGGGLLSSFSFPGFSLPEETSPREREWTRRRRCFPPSLSLSFPFTTTTSKPGYYFPLSFPAQLLLF